MKKDKKNNHYVQKAYLERFLDERVSFPKKHMWYYDKDVGKLDKTVSRKIA